MTTPDHLNSHDFPSPLDPPLAEALDQCIERLRRGATIEECQAACPGQATELKPLLEMAVQMLAVAELHRPTDAFRQLARRRVLAAARARQAVLKPKPLRRFGTLVASLVAAIVIGSSAVAASGNSLPGEPLYPVKRTAEAVTVQITADPVARAQLSIDLADRRVREIEQLAGQQRPIDGVLFDDLAYHTEWAIHAVESGSSSPDLIVRLELLVNHQVMILTEIAPQVPPPSRPSLDRALSLPPRAFEAVRAVSTPERATPDRSISQPTVVIGVSATADNRADRSTPVSLPVVSTGMPDATPARKHAEPGSVASPGESRQPRNGRDTASSATVSGSIGTPITSTATAATPANGDQKKPPPPVVADDQASKPTEPVQQDGSTEPMGTALARTDSNGDSTQTAAETSGAEQQTTSEDQPETTSTPAGSRTSEPARTATADPSTTAGVASTPTVGIASTSTPTATIGPTETPTATASAVATATMTATPTATAALVTPPTATATPVATATATLPVTPNATATPPATPTIAATPVATATVDAPRSVTPTPSGTPTPTTAPATTAQPTPPPEDSNDATTTPTTQTNSDGKADPQKSATASIAVPQTTPRDVNNRDSGRESAPIAPNQRKGLSESGTSSEQTGPRDSQEGGGARNH